MSDVFVGRDVERAALGRALDRAAQGDPALALVVGEAGIGKSRLVDALAADARARGVRVLWAEALDERHAPLRLWAPVERALALDRTPALATAGGGTDHGRGSSPSQPELPPSERRWELLDALVAGLADAAPAAVLLEDLHWADEASVWVLERLPRRLAGHGVLLVATSRRDEPGAVPLTGLRRQAGTVIELEGLDVAATEQLVDALAVPVPEGVDAADLVARTGGNPLFLRELLAMGGRGDRLPPAVSDVLTRSLSRLDEGVREALATLALAGPATPVAVLTAALGSTVDDVMARFEAAAAADVVTLGPAGRPTFRHVLLSAAAIEAVEPARRRRIHTALAGGWTVIDRSPSGRAHAATHRLAALPHGDPLAAGTEALAALEALRAAGDPGAVIELATTADQALEASGVAADGPGSPGSDGGRGHSEDTGGRTDDDTAGARRAGADPQADTGSVTGTGIGPHSEGEGGAGGPADRRTGTVGRGGPAGGDGGGPAGTTTDAGPVELVELRARIVAELARALASLGDDMGASRAFGRAADLVAALPGADPELRARVEAGAARRLNPFVAHPERLRRLGEADAALPPGDHPLRVELLARRAVLQVSVPGNIEAAHADGDAAVAMARRLGDPDLLAGALTDRHFVPADVQGLEARAAAADEMVALGERLRRPDVALQGYEWRFGDRLDRGRRGEAAAALEALEAYSVVMPSPVWQWSAVIRRGTMHAVDGDRAGLLACADQALVVDEDLGDEPEIVGVALAMRTSASYLWGWNDDRVDELCDRFDALSKPLQGLPFMALVMARVWCSIGRREQAVPVVHRFAAEPEPLFEMLEGIPVVAWLGSMVAELGMVEYAGSLRRALAPFVDRLASGGGSQLHTPVATTLGRLALLQGDTEAAVAAHRRAVAFAEAMPSPTLVALTSAYLAEALAAAGEATGAATAADRARRTAPAGMRLPDVLPATTASTTTAPATTASATTAGPTTATGDRRATLRRDGGVWRVEAPHGRAELAGSRGLEQLARLLAAPPGQEVPATELAGMDGAPVPVARDLGGALDARAKREYRRRINELQDDIDEAEAHHDPERAARARLELDALVQELRRAVGLDGRDRPTGSGAERARVNVTRSLKRAIAAVADQLPDLGAHLERSVRTGRYCAYSPEPSTALTWDVTD
ncbi:MAG TPA: AAA family ATPase [Acidimicrobiales bacterium]